MLGMLNYCNLQNEKIKNLFFSSIEILKNSWLYYPEKIRESYRNWKIERDNKLNKIVLLMICPWYARNEKELNLMINTIIDENKNLNKYILYVKSVYYLKSDEVNKYNSLYESTDNLLLKKIKRIDYKKIFNGYLNNYSFEESLIIINLLEATYKEIGTSNIKRLMKDYILYPKKIDLILEVLNMKYYILNNSTYIYNYTKFICLETLLGNKKRYEWFYNRSHQILAKNIIYNLIDDFVGSDECSEFKLNLLLEDYEGYMENIGIAFSKESIQYQFLNDLKQNLNLIMSNKEEQFKEGIILLNDMLRKYQINCSFIYCDSLDKAIDFMNNELIRKEVNYNEIFNEIYFK